MERSMLPVSLGLHHNRTCGVECRQRAARCTRRFCAGVQLQGHMLSGPPWAATLSMRCHFSKQQHVVEQCALLAFGGSARLHATSRADLLGRLVPAHPRLQYP